MDIDGARNMANLICKLDRSFVITRLIHAGDLDVDGRWRAEIENLRDDIGRLKEKLHAGKLAGQPLAEIVDVVTRRPAAFGLELNQDFPVGGADGAGIAVRKVKTGIGQADIIENRNEFLLRDRTTYLCIDLIGELRGFLDAEPRPGAIVETNLAGIDAREEIAAQEKNQACRKHAEAQEEQSKKH